jgi:hypothetical protein
VVLVAMVLSAAAGEARGDDAAVGEAFHDFHTTDRLTPRSTIGLELGHVQWDTPVFLSPVQEVDTAMRAVVAGHLVSEVGVGGYLAVPISRLDVTRFSAVDGRASGTQLMEAEAGAMYTRSIRPGLDYLVHLGAAFPAPLLNNDDHTLTELAYVVAPVRWRDLPLHTYQIWARAGASLLGTSASWFWRLDAGADLSPTEKGGPCDCRNWAPFVHGALAVGYQLPPVEITAEIAGGVSNLDGEEGNDETLSFATVSPGARVRIGRFHPGLAVVIPFVHEDELEEVPWAVAASVTYTP